MPTGQSAIHQAWQRALRAVGGERRGIVSFLGCGSGASVICYDLAARFCSGCSARSLRVFGFVRVLWGRVMWRHEHNFPRAPADSRSAAGSTALLAAMNLRATRDQWLTRLEWGACIGATLAGVWLHVIFLTHASGFIRLHNAATTSGARLVTEE